LPLLTVSAVDIGELVCRIEADCLAVVGGRVVEIPLGLVGVGSVVENVGNIGNEADHFSEVGDRAVEIPLGLVGAGSVVESGGNVGVAADRFSEVGDRTIVILPVEIHDSPAGEGSREWT